MLTLADLLAVNVFELDDWNYEGEEEEDIGAVDKTKVCSTKYFFTLVVTNAYVLVGVVMVMGG